MSTAQIVLKYLEPYNLKHKSGKHYRCNSPFRVNSDSHGFTLTIDDDEHGAYYDHVSNESGSLYELAERLGIARPHQLTSTRSAYTGLADYARRHGVTPEALTERGWNETNYQHRPALVFPTPNGNRYRFLDGKPKAAVYKSELGYKSCWYGFNSKVSTWLREGHPLVICNGEISSISGQEHGLASICVTNGEKDELPTQLLDELKGKLSAFPEIEILISMDCDATGVQTGLGLMKQFQAAGFNARAVNLKLPEKGDLADFCMLHGKQAEQVLCRLPDLHLLENGDSPYSWRVAEVDEILKLPPIEWHIPRVLPRRGVCTLYGPSGSFKSFVALAFALLIAQLFNVIYVAAEGEYGFKPRIQAWIQHYHQGYGKLKFILGAVNLFFEEEFAYFQQTLAALKPTLIVIDTFGMCMGEADENNTKDMMVIVRRAKHLATSLDCAVLFVHHTNKEGSQERGSGRLRDSCDTMIRISRHDDDLISVSSEKTKDSAPFPTYYLRPISIQLGYLDSLGEETTSLVLLPEEMVDEEDRLTERQRKVLEAIAFEPNSTAAEICAMTEIRTRGDIPKAIKWLKRKGYLEANGKPYVLTAKGEAALQRRSDSTDSSDASEFQVVSVSDERQPINDGVSGVKESTTFIQPPLLNGNSIKHHYTEGL